MDHPEQRWPALADLLIEHPEWIEQLAEESPEADKEKIPEPLRPFAEFKRPFAISSARPMPTH